MTAHDTSPVIGAPARRSTTLDTLSSDIEELSRRRVDVSVVICAYTTERWQLLRQAVWSVEQQLADDGSGSEPILGEVEIIVVIDHSDELLDAARTEWPQHRVVPNLERRGLSGARNTGVRIAAGELVAFLDDDASAEPHWLARLARHFDDPSVWGAGGYVEPRFVDGEPGWLPAEFGWVVGCSYRGQPTTVRDVRNPIGASMIFRRDAFALVGDFRDGMGRVGTIPLGCEETEFAIRVRAQGGRVVHDPAARVRHTVPHERARWRYFVRRCWAEGLSKAAVVDLSGADEGLASERAYVRRVLPRAVIRSLGRVVAGPRRGSAVGRATAIVVGSVVTAAGFARGRWIRRGGSG
jgi:glucosyl-dolichyl phosphate glucuronosyltransferase